jgi:hypothetical protein
MDAEIRLMKHVSKLSNVSEFLAQGNYVSKKWRDRHDSNLEPPDHESKALPTRPTRLTTESEVPESSE